MSSDGQLILLGDTVTENKNFEPISNFLRVGSGLDANVKLSGLKNVAFEIAIDIFGRVCITTFVKKLLVNEKRMAKNSSRPLMNSSIIKILNYTLCWKYNPKFTKSYSMSPCSKPNSQRTNERKRRMTVVGLNSHEFEDECAFVDAQKEPTALIDDENEQNPKLESTTYKPTDDSAASPCRIPLKPIGTLQATIDPVMQSKPRRTSLLIPVRENRATELRRASIRRSLSVPISFNSLTPKKPNPSEAMVKGVNATLRAGYDEAAMSKESSIKNRSVLDTTNLRKSNKTLSKSFTQIIGKMDMFSDVTDEMKKVGPSAYVSSVRKLGAMNSPRRTPKKYFSTPKRQSLRSELAELGICPIPAGEPIPAEEPIRQEVHDDLPVQLSDEMEERLQISSDESNDDASVISVDDDSDCQLLTSEDDTSDVQDSTEEILIVNSSRGPTESSQSSGAHIQTISDCERGSQIFSDLLGRGEDQLDDSVFSNDTETFVNLFAEDTPPNLDNGPSEQFRDKSMLLSQGDDKSDTNSEIINDTEAEAVSTPLTRRPSLIRTRRNSRLCSLNECCTPYASPRKTQSEKKVKASPRSILKTPNAPKTPKRNVRILEPVLIEEDDEEMKTSAENISQVPNALDETFEIDNDELVESSFVISEMRLSRSNKTPVKRHSTRDEFDDQCSSSVLNKVFISPGVQDTKSKSLERITSPESTNKIIHSEIDQRLQLDASEQKAQLEVSSGEIECGTFEKETSSTEVNDQEERVNMAETNQQIRSEKTDHREPQLDYDTSLNGRNVEEQLIIPMPNKKIVGGEENGAKSGNQSYSNSNKDAEEESEEEIFSPNFSSTVLPSQKESQLGVKIGEIERVTFEKRLSSPGLNDEEEQLNSAEMCQQIIVSSETKEDREPQLDSNTGTNFEEQSTSPESINEIISPGTDESLSNGSETNKEKSVERTDSPQHSKEINSLDIKETHSHCKVGGTDEKEQAEQQANPPVSRETILPEIEEVLQLNEMDENIEHQVNQSHCKVGGADEKEQAEQQANPPVSRETILPEIEEVLQLNEMDENIEHQVNQSHCKVGGTDEKEEAERQPNPSDSSATILPEIEEVLQLNEMDKNIEHQVNQSHCNSGKDKEEEFEESINSNEIILSEVQQEPMLQVNSSEAEGRTFDKLFTSSAPNDEDEQLNSTETSQQIIIPLETNEDREHKSDYNTSVCGTNDEEQSISPESIKKVISSDIEETHSHCNDGGKDEKEQSNQPEPSTEIILTKIGQELTLDESVELDERPNLSERIDDVGYQENKSFSNSDKDAEEESKEQIISTNLSNEVLPSEREPQLGVNFGEIERGIFEKRLSSPGPNDDDEQPNSAEMCQQIIVPSETKEEQELQLDSNIDANGKNIEKYSISPESINEIISLGADESHSNGSEENKEKSVERTNSSIRSLGIEEIHLHCNDAVKDEKVQPDERTLESSNVVILSVIDQKPQLDLSIGFEDRPQSSELTTDIEHQENQSYSNTLEEDVFEEPINVPELDNVTIFSEIKQETQSEVGIGRVGTSLNDGKGFEERPISPESNKEIIVNEGEESKKHNNPPVPSLNEPSTDFECNETHPGQLKLAFEFKSRRTILSTLNSVLGSYGMGALQWSDSQGERTENNAVPEGSSNVDTEEMVESLNNELNDAALATVPTRDIPESLTSAINDSETAIEIQSHSDPESSATIKEETTEDLKLPKSINIVPEKFSDSHANNIIESLNVPSRRGRMIITKVADDYQISKKEVTKSSTDESQMIFKTTTNDMRYPKRQRRTSTADDDLKIPKVSATKKIFRSTADKTNVHRGRKRKISDADDSQSTQTVADESQMSSKTPETSKNDVVSKDLELGAVENESSATVKKVVQRGRKRKIETATLEVQSNPDNSQITSEIPAQSDNDKRIPTRGRNTKTKVVDDDSKMTLKGRSMKTTVAENLEVAAASSTDESKLVSENSQISKNDVRGATRGRKAKDSVDSKDLELSEVENDSSATVKKVVQRGRKRKIETVTSEVQSNTDESQMTSEIPAQSDNDKRIPTRGRNTKTKVDDGSKMTRKGRTIKTTLVENLEVPVSSTDESQLVSNTPQMSKNDVRGPTRGRKAKDSVDSKDLELSEVENDSSATVKKVVQRGRKRKIETVTSEVQSNTDESQMTSEIPAQSDNDKRIPTRGRNTKTKVDDDSKMTRKGRSKKTTVAENLEVPVSSTSGRKSSEVDPETESEKPSLEAVKKSSKAVTRKGRKVSEVDAETKTNKPSPNRTPLVTRGNRNAGNIVTNDSQEPKRQKLMKSSIQAETLSVPTVPLAKRLRSCSAEPPTITTNVPTKANTRSKRGGK